MPQYDLTNLTATTTPDGQNITITITGQTKPTPTPTPTPAPTPTAPANRPANPAAIVYPDNPPGQNNAALWAKPGALVVVGHTNYNEPWVHTIADGGATVLIYLDCIAWNTPGRYSQLLYNASELGPQVPLFPGPLYTGYTFDGFRVNVADFRPGSILHTKLPGVLDKIAAENPHISGIFCDDLGTRSWFDPANGAFNWNNLSNTLKEQWRNGAIAIAQTHRNKADQHNWFLIANGTWGAQPTTGIGDGGYPNRNTFGCSLVDGGGVEMHNPYADTSYWQVYAHPTNTQWGAATPRKLPYMFFMSPDAGQRSAWTATNLPAYAHQGDYSTLYTPYKPFTDFGLPNRAS